MAGALQHEYDALYIIAPMMPPCWIIILKLNFDGFGKIDRMNDQFTIVAWGHRQPYIKINRSRHNKTIIVIRMFADQIHAARSAVNPRDGAEALAESAEDVGELSW